MSTTTQARAQMVQDTQDCAARLRHLPDLASTVRTFALIVEEVTKYGDADAVVCTEQLQRLVRTHNPRHTGTQTYADHIEASAPRRGGDAPPARRPWPTTTRPRKDPRGGAGPGGAEGSAPVPGRKAWRRYGQHQHYLIHWY